MDMTFNVAKSKHLHIVSDEISRSLPLPLLQLSTDLGVIVDTEFESFAQL